MECQSGVQRYTNSVQKSANSCDPCRYAMEAQDTAGYLFGKGKWYLSYALELKQPEVMRMQPADVTAQSREVPPAPAAYQRRAPWKAGDCACGTTCLTCNEYPVRVEESTVKSPLYMTIHRMKIAIL